jgi:hypothetical protein
MAQVPEPAWWGLAGVGVPVLLTRVQPRIGAHAMASHGHDHRHDHPPEAAASPRYRTVLMLKGTGLRKVLATGE